MKKVTEELAGGHVTPGGCKREEAKLECGVLSGLQTNTSKKNEEKKETQEENEFATSQWQFVEMSYTKFHQNQSQNIEISDKKEFTTFIAV